MKAAAGPRLMLRRKSSDPEGVCGKALMSGVMLSTLLWTGIVVLLS